MSALSQDSFVNDGNSVSYNNLTAGNVIGVSTLTLQTAGNLNLNDPTTNTLTVAPVPCFTAFQSVPLAAITASTVATSAKFNALLALPGTHMYAVSINYPLVDQSTAALTSLGWAGVIIIRDCGTAGGGQAPLVADQPFSVTNTATTGPPVAGISVAFVAQGAGSTSPFIMNISVVAAVQAGVMTITRLC